MKTEELNEIIPHAMMEISGLNTAENEQERANALHNLADSLSKFGDKAKLALAVVWKEIKEREYWKIFGDFNSFFDYISQKFNYRPSTVRALLMLHTTYVDELKLPLSEISQIPWYSLKAVHHYVDESNVRDILEAVKHMSQSEVNQYVKVLRGEAEKVEKKNPVFRVSVSNEQKEIIEKAIKCAETATQSSDKAMNLEFICADYLLENLTSESGKEEKLQEWLERFEKIFGKWE